MPNEDEDSHWVVTPGSALLGTLRVPGDKSISHRAIMLAALADGVSVIHGCLLSKDTLATVQAFKQMGVLIELTAGPGDQTAASGTVTVHGVGMHGLQQPVRPLYLGNAGTAMRLLAGLLAAQPFTVVLTGDASLTGRPMARVVKPLVAMGAAIKTAVEGKPPLTIAGRRTLQAIQYALPMASAQVQSALLLAGLYAQGETRIAVPEVVRDHTQRLLLTFGYPVTIADQQVLLVGHVGRLHATSVAVPADISSAAFLMVAASITPGSDIRLTQVGINPTRTRVITILKRMGADITISHQRQTNGEPVADIRVRAAPLQGITIPTDWVANAIDDLPIVLVAAACATGRTVLQGAQELRIKESDRLQAMAAGFRALGVAVELQLDGMIVQGGQPITGGTVNSRGDHRIAMAFAIAALRAAAPVRILHCANVAASFPNFVQLAGSVGIMIHTDRAA